MESVWQRRHIRCDRAEEGGAVWPPATWPGTSVTIVTSWHRDIWSVWSPILWCQVYWHSAALPAPSLSSLILDDQLIHAMQWRNFKKYFSESSHVTTCKPLSSPPAELQLARSARDCVAPDPEPRPALANQPAAGTESCEIRSKLRYSRFPETLISRPRQGPGRDQAGPGCHVRGNKQIEF